MELVVVADTHLRHGIEERLPAQLLRAIEHCDLVLHAGDVTSRQALEDLRLLTPTRAVLGNNDAELVGILSEVDRFELEGVPFAMIHDSGARVGREHRMAERFTEAAVVVFGHSHIPVQLLGPTGQLLFNPGSPTQRRAQPHASFGLIEVADGAVLRREIVVL